MILGDETTKFKKIHNILNCNLDDYEIYYRKKLSYYEIIIKNNKKYNSKRYEK